MEQGTAATGVREMSPTELKERIDGEQPLILVDVREPHEREIADLPAGNRLAIPVRELFDRMHEIDPDDPVILYCRTGGRSRWAAERLVDEGYAKVWNLTGGVMGWRRDVDPSLTEY